MTNNPYRVIFESLPFEDAIEFSIKYARNKVGAEIAEFEYIRTVKKWIKVVLERE